MPSDPILDSLCAEGVANKKKIHLSWWRLHAGGGAQRFGRAINFQIRTKLSAGIYPRLRETARYLSFFFHRHKVSKYLYFKKMLYFCTKFYSLWLEDKQSIKQELAD
jgi:hypothetical protein